MKTTVNNKGKESRQTMNELPRIHVSDAVFGALKHCFPDKSRQMIHSSLCFYSKSKLAESIRRKAVELNEAELKKQKSYGY